MVLFFYLLSLILRLICLSLKKEGFKKAGLVEVWGVPLEELLNTIAQDKENSKMECIKRTGKTHEHYLQQKGQCFAYFKVNSSDAEKVSKGQFTIYDFINNSFSFSSTKKELTIAVLEALKQSPKSFNELVVYLNAKKSTLYLLCLAIKRSGMIAKGSDSKYVLSQEFASSLENYASWWRNWLSF